MNRIRKPLLFACWITVVALAVPIAATTPAPAQSATRGSGSATRSGQPVQQPFEAKFWDYLQKAKYVNWAPVPGQSDAAYEGQSPHGAFLKMYLNRKAAGNAAELPDGSIIVKENYGSDGKTLMAITVMYKVAKYNPDAADWYWVKYSPDGKAEIKSTPAGNMKLAGKPNGCIECHASAEGDDFAFFNDRP